MMKRIFKEPTLEVRRRQLKQVVKEPTRTTIILLKDTVKKREKVAEWLLKCPVKYELHGVL